MLNACSLGAGQYRFDASAMDSEQLSALTVVVPNLHWRYSGVTATNRMVAPRLARLLSAAWFGTHAPEGIRRLTVRDIIRLRGRAQCWKARIWHARRNDEMLIGLALRGLGWPFKLVFTSAAQRHHTWITRFLISRMDGVIATTEAAASYLERGSAVIHHGVDTALYRPPVDRQAAFTAAGLPGRYAIGAFGRVRAQKGTDVFVAAMCRLLPKYPDFTAVVIGRVTLEHRAFFETLRGEVEKAGLSERIRFLGEL